MRKYFIAFFAFIFSIGSVGCTLESLLITDFKPACTQQIAQQIPKWTLVGEISKAYPNPMRVLMLHTGDMGKALRLIQESTWKYDKKYLQTLPLGSSIYISKDNEVFINRKGGPAPDETVTIYTQTGYCSKRSVTEQIQPGTGKIDISDIKEEDLAE